MMSDLESYFDKMAVNYDKAPFTQFTSQEVDFIFEELNLAIGSRVLDIDCGTGRHSIELAKRGCSVTGVDISEKMLDIAKAKAVAAQVEINWIADDARKFVSKEPFDSAISIIGGAFGVLEARDDAILNDFILLRSICRNLRNQGKLIVEAVNGCAVLRQVTDEDIKSGEFDFRNMRFSDPLIKERCYVPTEIELLFRYAGFRVLHIWGGNRGKWKCHSLRIQDELMLVVAQKEQETRGHGP